MPNPPLSIAMLAALSGAATVATSPCASAQCPVESFTSAAVPFNSWFGQSVALSGDTAIVGAPREGALETGAVYVFERSATNWALADQFEVAGAGTRSVSKSSSTARGWVVEGTQGVGIARDAERLLVGVSATQTATVYELDHAQNYCTATRNSTGVPASIARSGALAVDRNAFARCAHGLPADVPGLFVYGPQRPRPHSTAAFCASTYRATDSRSSTRAPGARSRSRSISPRRRRSPPGARGTFSSSTATPRQAALGRT